MSPEESRLFVAIILGKETDAGVMQHAIDFFLRLQIPHEVVLLSTLSEGIAGYLEDRAPRVALVGTEHAYTDELIPSPAETTVPIFRVITGPAPPSGQMASNVATTGFGEAGAVNAAPLAARVLALEIPDLADRLREEHDRDAAKGPDAD